MMMFPRPPACSLLLKPICLCLTICRCRTQRKADDTIMSCFKFLLFGSQKTWTGRAKLGKRLCSVDCSLDRVSMQSAMTSFKANSMCVFLLQITVSSSLSLLRFPPLLSLCPTHSSRLRLREPSLTTSSLIVQLGEKHTSSVVSGWQIMTSLKERTNNNSKK